MVQTRGVWVEGHWGTPVGRMNMAEKLIDAHHRMAAAHEYLARTSAILAESANAVGGSMVKKAGKNRGKRGALITVKEQSGY